MNEARTAKDGWDKLQALGVFIGAVGVPVVLAWLGHAYNAALRESENRVKYVELAVSILRTKPGENTEDLRAWAADLLSKQSPVTLSPEAQARLKTNQLVLPTSGAIGGNAIGDEPSAGGGMVGSIGTGSKKQGPQ